MSVDTKIQWCHHTKSPWFGCKRVSAGCDRCYAELDNARYKRNGTGTWGDGAPRVLSKSFWTEPLAWDRRIARARAFDPIVNGDMRERVFPSLCDPFDEAVPDHWRDAMMVMIHATPYLDWLLLTKREKEALRYLTKARERDIIAHRDMALYGVGESPLSKRAARASLDRGISHFPNWHNLHIGVTVENQPNANNRRETFRAIPVASKFVSYEPALGPVDWTGWEFVQQVIVGGESGGGARPFDVRWAEDTVAWCRANGVAPFVKQLGAVPMESEERWRGRVPTRLLSARNRGRVPAGFVPLAFADPKGGNLEHWPIELRVREFPQGVAV
jgi:protein gp37